MRKLLVQDGQQLVLDIVDNSTTGSGLLARVPITYTDMQLPRDETWWDGVRKGQLEPLLDKYALLVIPGQEDGAGKLDGYSIELRHETTTYRRHFDIHSLASVAQRTITQLVASKAAHAGESLNYYLTAVPGPEEIAEADGSSVHREPLVFESGCLADFLQRSQPLIGATGPPEQAEPEMEIFVAAQAWQEAREQAFRGGQVESAALMCGRLYEDTTSHDKFLCLDACLETPFCEETPTSVTFTAETWARVRQLRDIRRRRLNVPHEIIAASVHRHPFLPATDAAGRRMCDVCSARQYCSRSTAVPSADDFEWHRSVFSGQPFCTLLIWGYTARGEEDFRLYGLRNGTFQQRSIRLLNP